MGKKVIIVVTAAIVLIGGGVAAYMMTRPDDTQSSSTSGDEATTQTTTEESVATASIKEFLLAGENKQCTFQDADIRGTLYFAGDQRMRQDYESTNAAEPGSGSMIVLQEKQYIWSNDTKEGMIFAFNPEEEAAASEEAAETPEEDSVDLNKEFEFTCRSWRVDESLFTPPSDVKFTDMAAMMQQFQQ